MPITIEVVDKNITHKDFNDIWKYFDYVDQKFSTYKDESEISKINNKSLKSEDYSSDMKLVLKLCDQTKDLTNGYFNINKNGYLDPSGLVKGWAIYNAANILKEKGFRNFYIDAGGDIQTYGNNSKGEGWKIGIRNPFNREENVKVLKLSNVGIATSGTAIRGQHIYNPKKLNMELNEIVSLTVIGPNVYEADRFATPAFAMQRNGINFIENLKGFEGYMIDSKGITTFTSGFNKYVE
ncbi:MAG TPA: FAD:protein FMN transferase [Candidatus Dojkabacteria bacterium]|nr:FAD:protein FMN transferase [Candidatus Dojkabacteria bacterium]